MCICVPVICLRVGRGVMRARSRVCTQGGGKRFVHAGEVLRIRGKDVSRGEGEARERVCAQGQQPP